MSEKKGLLVVEKGRDEEANSLVSSEELKLSNTQGKPSSSRSSG